MRATQKEIEQIRDAANEIAIQYGGWQEPKHLQQMYDELESIGVTTGLISNGNDRCEWYYEGEEVETSYFIYQKHNGEGRKNDYNIYFS